MKLPLDDRALRDWDNSSNSTAITNINSHWVITTNSLGTNSDDMKHILLYAIPLSCVAIIVVLILAIGSQRRQRVLEKWSSLTRMRNTNPRVTERAGLRRDSEYESVNEGIIHVTILNEDGQLRKEPEFRLASIT